MKTMQFTSSTLLAFACLCLNPTFAFQAPIKPANAARRASTILPSTLQNVDKSRQVTRRRYNVIDRPDPSALTFSGQIAKTSRPLVSLDDKESLVEFFQSSAARDTLFVSDAEPVPIQPISPLLLREWQLEAQSLGVTLPTREEADQQIVMQLCSKGISFSGLTVETTVNCGAKLIEYNPDTGLPSYEFTMIKDSTNASGPRPLLWIYNQVMGLVSRKGNQQKTTTSLCRIALVEVEGGLGIDFESSFQVKVNFPSFLIRILPISKSTAEKQGSSAVTKFVQKGVVDSLQRFEQSFLETQKLKP